MTDKKVILVRQAESISEGFGTRYANESLTYYGYRTCKCLTFEVDLVICSTLKRSRQTLDNSGIQYKNVIFTPLCREFKDDNEVNFYEGEKIVPEDARTLHKRIKEFKELIKTLSAKYDTICVITHYMFMRELTGFEFKNCHYLTYKIEDLCDK
jgi:broad specificity phosphatase PhoE